MYLVIVRIRYGLWQNRTHPNDSKIELVLTSRTSSTICKFVSETARFFIHAQGAQKPSFKLQD